jgi:hypothetical protein
LLSSKFLGRLPAGAGELMGEVRSARDSEGRIGLIDEFCAHRGLLWFGQNEECGLRCPYHG